MKTFSNKWKSSKNRRKQRKYRANAPLHTKGKFLHAMLSKELKKKYSKNSIRLRKGDNVLIMRGQFKKKTGEVTVVKTKIAKAFVSGAELTKKDGTKIHYPIAISNLQITVLKLEDNKRKKSLERGAKK
ncbi:MAG: 50S ribosomal protein L24 [Nanoarchaeota archaeon]